MLRRRRAPPTWRAPRPAACTCSTADERDPKTTTSYGLGAAGRRRGGGRARTEVVVGLGGSATNDGGAGMLAALGAAPLDAAGVRAAVRRRGAGRRAPRSAACRGCARRPPGRRHRRRQPADRPARRQQRLRPAEGRRPRPTCCCSTPRWSGSPACWRRICRLPAAAWRRCPAAGAAGGLGAALLALGGRLRVRASAWSRAADRAGRRARRRRPGDHRRGLVRPPVAARQGGRRGGRRRPRPGPALRGAGRAGRAPAAGRPPAAGVTEAYSLVEHFGGVERGAGPARPRACARLGARAGRPVDAGSDMPSPAETGTACPPDWECAADGASVGPELRTHAPDPARREIRT